MKAIMIVLLMMVSVVKSHGQSQEAQQLLLNVEKLAQMKQILKDMYKGYEIVSEGYSKVKEISKGNFDLHKVFLDKMLAVSPAVKQYKKVSDIIMYQGKILKEYKAAFLRFKTSNLFNDKEIEYMSKVYAHLNKESVENLDELLIVITAGKLRMTDEERIKAIDRIFADMEDKLLFLRNFNKGTGVLAVQRQKEKTEVDISRRLQGIR